MSTINERIKEVMERYSLSIKEIAEKCDVQRAAVSHILNGRNRPSVPFLTALSESLPELNTSWLLHGKGEMVTSVSESPVTSVNKEVVGDTNVSEKDLNVNFTGENIPGKQVERIIVLYQDGSFSSYEPNQS